MSPSGSHTCPIEQRVKWQTVSSPAASMSSLVSASPRVLRMNSRKRRSCSERITSVRSRTIATATVGRPLPSRASEPIERPLRPSMPQPSRSLSGRLAATMRPLESSTHAGESACSTIATERRSPGRPRRPQCLRNRPFVRNTLSTPLSTEGPPARSMSPPGLSDRPSDQGIPSGMFSIGRLYIIGSFRWRTAPIGCFAPFLAHRQARRRRGRPVPGRTTRITRLTTTRYDLAVGPTDRPGYPRSKPVIQPQRATPSRGFHPMTYVIAEPCIDVKDKSCIEECPVDCIYEGDRMLYIQPDECVDCGACEPVCPVEAIFYEGDDPLGSPGGAAKVGPQVRDAAFVANYTPAE